MDAITDCIPAITPLHPNPHTNKALKANIKAISTNKKYFANLRALRAKEYISEEESK